MERSEISRHEVEVYNVLLNAPDTAWLSNAEIAEQAKAVSPRTVRMHTRRFARLGLLDVAEVFPAHRYRLSSKAEKRNQSYVVRLQAAMDVFGLNGRS